MSNGTSQNGHSDNTFKFLITTDNHLGYKQDDHIRRKDSFMAFAEALEIGRYHGVDFILLGGDLFHTNKPSYDIEHKCIKIIRQHMNAHGARGPTFKRLSGEFSHFQKVKHANFEDPNLKVSYPILTIHGNHDDPTGPSAKSVCEKLATAGLLNYFGIVKLSDKIINIQPIVLEKNGIKIALYGIGFIPDRKLRTSFQREQVIFAEPPPDTYNVLVVHQNRVAHVKDNHIPDDFFPSFFHLIVRGHEHDLQPPEVNPTSKVNGLVYQPGSTVATSIGPMEAGPKKVGLITVGFNQQMTYELVPIQCCRAVIYKDIPQKEVFKYIKATDGSKKLTPVEYRKLFRDFVKLQLKSLLNDYAEKQESQMSVEEKESQKSGSSVRDKLHRFALPLMRLRLEYVNKSEKFDDLEVVSGLYMTKVANRDVILFRKQKLHTNEDGQVENVTFDNENDDEDDQDDFDVIDIREEQRDTIDVMIESYFANKPEGQRLEALSLQEYTNAVRGAAEDGNVISKVLSKKKHHVLRNFKESLKSDLVAERDFHDLRKVQDWFTNAFKSELIEKNEFEVIDCGEDEFSDDGDIICCN